MEKHLPLCTGRNFGQDFAKHGLSMKKTTLCLCLALCAGSMYPSYVDAKDIDSFEYNDTQNQRKKITGKVVDAAGMPIIGANIMEKGTLNGTITDLDGNFSLEVKPGAVLLVSYIGYNEQAIPVGETTVFNLRLTEDTQHLEEVVVVGYGTQKKVNLTGSVSNVKADLMENRTSSSPVNMLTGNVAGVTIVQNSGQPGADTGTLRVRGVGT